jgi:hypothetical protein
LQGFLLVGKVDQADTRDDRIERIGNQFIQILAIHGTGFHIFQARPVILTGHFWKHTGTLRELIDTL